MSRQRLWHGDVYPIGGRCFLVLLSRPGEPTFGVVVSYIHTKVYASPIRPEGTYKGAPMQGVVPPPRNRREIYAAARYLAEPWLRIDSYRAANAHSSRAA